MAAWLKVFASETRERARLLPVPTSLAFVLASLILVTPASADVDWTKVLGGDVVVEKIKNEDGLDGLRTAFAVTASRDRIWRVLTDYDNYAKIFPRINKIDVLEQDESGATIEYWTDAVVTDLHFVLRRSYVEHGHKLTWRRVSGDLERIEGSWLIVDTPDPDISAVIFDSYLDAGSELMSWGARLGAEQEAKRMALRLKQWIEGTIPFEPAPPNPYQFQVLDTGR